MNIPIYQPLFSVLIANHNDGKYIECAIDSILKQTYTNWEIIIVDDASTDNSKSIYSKYNNDNRFHIFFNDNQMGCGYTKRRCIELANGEICGFVDADDALTNDALEIMVQAHNNNISLAYSYYYKCNDNLEIESISNHQCQIPSGSSFLEYKRGSVSHFATFKKSTYLKTSGINESYLIAEDQDLYFKLEEVGDLLFIPTPLYYYRCNTGNNISLGDNLYRAAIWEFYVRASACERRGLNIEKIAFPIINYKFYEQKNNILNSKQYKLGNALLKPFLTLKHFLVRKR